MAFNHDKIRQVVYQALPEGERKLAHQRAAQAIFKLDAPQIEALAYHYDAGEVWEKAVAYHRQAGERASDLYATQSALQHFSRALQILADSAPFSLGHSTVLKFDCLKSRQRLFWLTGEVERQQEDLQALQKIAASPAEEVEGNDTRTDEALNQQAHFLCYVRDDYPQARQTAQLALDLAKKHDISRQAAISLELIGESYRRSDQLQEAESVLRQSLAVWQEIADATRVAEVYAKLADLYWRMGRIEEAQSTCQAGVKIAEETNNLLALANIYKILGTLAHSQGDYQSGIRHTETSLQQSQAIGYRRNEAVLSSNLGILHWELRDYGRAIDLMKQGLTRSSQNWQPPWLLSCAQQPRQPLPRDRALRHRA